MSYTLLLVKLTTENRSRCFSKYHSVNECLEGVCKLYEEQLRKHNVYLTTVTYDLRQLFEFIDDLDEICVMVYQKVSGTYAPYKRKWIKEKIMVLMESAAQENES